MVCVCVLGGLLYIMGREGKKDGAVRVQDGMGWLSPLVALPATLNACTP